MTDAVILQTIGNRYQVMERIGTGGMGAVFRAKDRLTGQIIALKRVMLDHDTATSTGSDSLDHRLALAREFKTLASLRHPNIIGVLDYGFDAERQPFVTMELVENARTLMEAAQKQPRPRQIALLVQVLQALAYLHRRGIIHRDLKPANVIVTPGDVVKLVDFGIAQVITSRTKNQLGGIIGTLAFMAPELLMEEPATAMADLYSFGVMAYEVFTGELPFTGHLGSLVNKIMLHAPDLSRVDERLGEVLAKLLAKRPAERYTDAGQVIAALCKAVGVTPPVESAAVRESFLQAAQFIGREQEMSQLKTALEDTLKGRGSAWLVGGESGVGKSRLVEELRILAMVKGTLTLHGQTVSEGGIPFQVIQEPLRRLVLATDISSAEASLLTAIVPDMLALVPGHKPPRRGPGVIENPEVRQRLLMTIMDIFRRLNQPVVLILEDLHWASESLELVRQLTREAKDHAWLIIGNYRDDERPDIPQSLPDMQHLKLERLKADEIARLSESILGVVGKQPELVELLRRETEGNVFFIVEVMRSLAEDSGALHDIGRATLPSHIFSGGIRQVVRRRLSRIPPEAQRLLKLAAVAGRVLDLGLMLALDKEEQLDIWLDTCVDAAVLELSDGQWRFTHDKLREGILADLSEAEEVTLNQEIAEVLDKLYPDLPEQAARRAHHWKLAGNPVKERACLMLAAQYAEGSGGHRRVKNFLERALLLAGELRDNADPAWYADVYMHLGRAYSGLGDYDTAHDYFEKELALHQSIGNRAGIASALNNLAGMAWRKADYLRAREYGLQSEAIYRELNQPEGIAHSLVGLSHVARWQGDYGLARRYAEEALALSTALDDRYGMVDAHNNLGLEAQMVGDYHRALDHFEACMTLGREMGTSPGMINTLTNMGIICSTFGAYDAARRYLEEGLKLARETSTPRNMANILSNLGNVAFHQRRYMEAQEHLTKALMLAREIGHHRVIAWSLEKLGSVALIFGQEDDAETHLLDSLQEARQTGEPYLIASSLTALGALEVHRRRLPEAHKHFYHALKLLWDTHAIPNALSVIVHFALLMRLEGQMERAIELVSMVQSQPNLNSETRELLDEAFGVMHGGLAPDAQEVAMARGADLELERVVHELLKSTK